MTPLPPGKEATSLASISSIRDALARHGRVLVRNAFLDDVQLQRLVRALLDPDEANRSPDPFSAPGVAVPTRATQATAPALPLHRDGALVGSPTKVIAFSALASTPGAGSLETVESIRALPALDPHLQAALKQSTWEYRLHDRGPFTHLPDGWFERATFVDSEAGRALNVILPEREGEHPTPWEVRLNGHDATSSRAFTTALDDGLRASPDFIAHQWQDGDLVVIDNDHVLHGLAAVPSGSRHRVLRASA